GDEAGLRERALPPCVDPTAVLVLAGRVVPLPGWEVEVGPVAPGLVGADAGTAHLAREETADGKRVVANHLGVEPEAGLTAVEPVGGIAIEQLGRRTRALPVGGRGDDRPHHPLHVPAAL